MLQDLLLPKDRSVLGSWLDRSCANALLSPYQEMEMAVRRVSGSACTLAHQNHVSTSLRCQVQARQRHPISSFATQPQDAMAELQRLIPRLL